MLERSWLSFVNSRPFCSAGLLDANSLARSVSPIDERSKQENSGIDGVICRRFLTADVNDFRRELVFACICGQQILHQQVQSRLNRIKRQAASKHLQHSTKLIIIKVRARGLAISLER